MNIKPTRMELLNIKKKLKLAQKGHKLLKQKQDVLVMEFFSILKDIKELRMTVADRIVSARDSLLNAEAVEGNIAIERIAVGMTGGVDIEFGKKSIMGVTIPEVRHMDVKEQWPGFYNQTIEIDNAISKYRKLFPNLITLAEKQLMLSHLAEEIKKTKRRVNSLEYITIPAFDDIKKLITFKLEELERENFSRLKHIKKSSAG